MRVLDQLPVTSFRERPVQAKLGQEIAGAVHEGIGNAKKGGGPQ
jgi:hypothetical protein